MEYGMNERKGDRVQVSVVAYDDGGAAEVFWARSQDILSMDHEGSVVMTSDGAMHMRMNRDDGEPLSVSIYGNRIVVRHTEDIVFPVPDSGPVVFDSDDLELEES